MSSRLIEILLDSFPQILLPGLTMTLPLTAISFSLALVIALATALVQFAQIRVLRQIARFYIWVVRGTPLLVQLFVVFYGLPGVGVVIDPFPSAVIVFSINEGAYCAETLRAALESVPAGQMEAARCVGMRYAQALPAHRDSAGAAHGVSAAVQFADRDGEGHLAGGEHHRGGDVHGHAAHRGAHL